MSEHVKTVAVTGASGYIASWVVKKLLDRGYRVHATVRDVNNTEKIVHLLRFNRAHPDQLKLFNADLLTGGFKEAFEGCEAVIHMASPFQISKIKNPQKELVDPAVGGTERVLQAVNETESIQKVILTSSVVAIYNDAVESDPLTHNAFTPDMWNTHASLTNQPYKFSKTEAEKLAWKMAEAQQRWSLSTIHPGFVLGPSLSNRVDGVSMDFMKSLLTGTFKIGAPDISLGIVDVRDVAECHIHALEVDHEPQRFIAVKEVMRIVDMAENIQRVTERVDYPVPTTTLPYFLLYIFGPLRGYSWNFLRRNLGYNFAFDTSATETIINVKFRTTDDTFRDMALQLERDDLISLPN